VTRRAGKLDRFFGRIMHCQVVVEVNQRSHRHGKRYRVSLDMTVPRRHEIAIARPPSPTYFLDDPHAAVDRAFDEAERRLVDWEQRLRSRRRRSGALRPVEIVA